MIKIYLCEDELSQLNYFKKVIAAFITEKHIDAEIVSARKNPLFTLNDIQKNGESPALFSLDVELKDYELDGFKLAKKLKEKTLESYIVFLTLQEDLAFKAFEYKLEPLDYIIKKPEYFLSNRLSNEISERITKIFEKVEMFRKKRQDYITLSSGGRILEIKREDILFIQAIKGSHQIEIYLPYKKITIRQTLKYMRDLLDDSFIYINKSCLVHRAKIREIHKKEHLAYLEGGYQLDVAYREMKNLCNIVENKELYGLVTN